MSRNCNLRLPFPAVLAILSDRRSCKLGERVDAELEKNIHAGAATRGTARRQSPVSFISSQLHDA